jgi:signal transduction histidine kinase
MTFGPEAEKAPAPSDIAGEGELCPFFPNHPEAMTVDELPYHAVRLSGEVPGSEIARLFEQDRNLPGVIIAGPGQLLHLVARSHFYQRLGRLYGVEIYMPRPIVFFLESVAEQPLIVPHSTNVQNAVVTCLARGENVYDPFLVVMPGDEPRLVTFESLILKQTELLSVAQIEAQAQKSRAIEANNAKSEFLAVMSHELRTPLTAIIGYGEIVLEDAAVGCLEDVAGRVQNIVSAGHHLLEMINGILDLAKIEAGKTELAFEDFSLPAFVESLTGTVLPLVEKNANEFRLITEKDLGGMYCDKTKLKQCLLNLLGNASKFTQKGRISLRVSEEPYAGATWAAFEIADTGIGMTEAQLQKLFQPFYQADSSISRRFGGTGLGLSLTKRYCEMMGGTLTVRSVPELGSTFTMRLPTLREKTAKAELPPSVERATQKIPLVRKSRKRNRKSLAP